ncbi:MAG: fused DSP-PTPase phosphatase/NAD kinase-like protein [Mangrovicoccus sp.]
MGSRLKSWFREFERDMRRRYGGRIDTPTARRQAFWHFQLLDHAFLRYPWWNLAEIAPGVWRSNQPSQGRVKRYADMGIKTILNLRGVSPYSPYLFESEACEKYGVELVNIELSARKLVPRKAMIELVDIMRGLDKPFLLHCKSGSDRAGMASAIYLAVIEGRPVKEARKQLHWRYLHLSSTDTGILDHVFDVYEAETATSGQGFEDWLKTSYDNEALTASWNAKRA